MQSSFHQILQPSEATEMENTSFERVQLSICPTLGNIFVLNIFLSGLKAANVNLMCPITVALMLLKETNLNI